MQNTSALSRQRQIRVFVIAWLGITLLMGALTFVGIYYATGLVNNEDNGNGDDASVAALPNPGPDDEGDAAVLPDAGPNNGFDPDDVQATPVPTADNANPRAVAQAAAGGGLDAPPAQAEPTVTFTPSPTPLPVDNPVFQLGIQVQENPEVDVYRIWMEIVRDALKLDWIKQQVRWDYIEPQPGEYDWTALDVAFALASEHNIKVAVSVLTAPDWAREPGAPLDKVGPPADPQVYADFVTTLLQRYPDQIHAVEVWNEMNLDREWASIYGLSAQNYVELLRVAYAAIKAVDPGIIVISGALSPTGVNDGVGAYDDFVYMDMLIQAGVLETTDCVGVHHNGYNIGPNVPWNNVPNDPTAVFRGPFDNPHHSWSFYSTLNGYAQKIQQVGSDKKLCVTEFGWATTEDLGGTPVTFEFADDNTLEEQAAFFDEAIQLMQDWDFVWLAWIWNLNYGAQAGWDPSNDNVPYALLRPEWYTAPAYEVIAKYNFRGAVE